MDSARETKRRLAALTCAAVCLALCLTLPLLTMQLRSFGRMLAPMHFPVLLAGFLCGPWWAGAVGLIAPVLRHAVFAQPPVPNCYAMALELATYGVVTGLLHRAAPKRTAASLLAAMLAGRAVFGLAMALVTGGTYTWKAFVAAAFLDAWPGMLLQLALIPALLAALRRAGITGLQKT